ncbi:hypothetical protein, partial [Methylobacterium cerastii]|uniref:hypothetical protein n=1 Tax=Methylobacterium cerastii TaxID=932741 RepID=UPI001EE2076D
MSKPNTAARKPNATAAFRDRAARLRDTAGRFTKRKATASPAPEPERPTSATEQVPASLGTIPAPANASDDAYALMIQGDGLGLHAAPGASLVVEPEMPTGAGLAVFYLKGKVDPVVFDPTQ